MLKRLLKRFNCWLSFNPPGALTSKGWRLFEKEFKEEAPIRHWINNDFKHGFIYPIRWKYQGINEWIRYRTYNRYHILRIGLPPSYYSVEERMLHVNFNLLKDFVEVEQAWKKYHWSNEEDRRTFFQKLSRTYFRYIFRRPELGIQHLEWAATLDDPSLPPHEQCIHQAIAAREILALYDWWVNKRPSRKRIEPPKYDYQGINDILSCFDNEFDCDAPDYKAHVEAIDKQNKIDEEWIKEDDEMLLRLVKIRLDLWT